MIPLVGWGARVVRGQNPLATGLFLNNTPYNTPIYSSVNHLMFWQHHGCFARVLTLYNGDWQVTEEPWGYHLLYDLEGCDKELISSKDNILSWIKELVPAIDMVAYGEPKLEHFATNKEKTAGYSLVQLIETSNVTAHFAERIGSVRIDVFSCKEFEMADACQVSDKYFKPMYTKSRFIDR